MLIPIENQHYSATITAQPGMLPNGVCLVIIMSFFLHNLLVVCNSVHSHSFVQHEHNSGRFRESNPGPLAPKARIMPLDQTALMLKLVVVQSN